MEARAYAKNVRISPRKVRLVLDNIRGRNVKEAAAILQFSRVKAGAEVGKVLKSAVSNAVNNQNAEEDDLYVKECYADDGRTLKRWMPRAKGNASQILKRSSHITVVVSDETPVPAWKKKRDRKAARAEKVEAMKAEREKKAAGEKVEEKAEEKPQEEPVKKEEPKAEKKAAAKKPAEKKTAGKKPAEKKEPAKKEAAKKPAGKKTAEKKPAAKKAAGKEKE